MSKKSLAKKKENKIHLFAFLDDSMANRLKFIQTKLFPKFNYEN